MRRGRKCFAYRIRQPAGTGVSGALGASGAAGTIGAADANDAAGASGAADVNVRQAQMSGRRK